MTIRTRIAPSPTGADLHIGNAYTALINFVVAKKKNGKFVVRIEDTDRSRLVEGSEQHILSSLDWLGITHDEGPDVGGPYQPYRQSERLAAYKQYAEELIANGHAYYCFCTPERLELMRKDQEAKHMPPMYDGRCRELKIENCKLKIKNGESHVVRLKVPHEGTTTFRDLIRGDISFENKLIDDQVLLKSDGFPTYHLGVVVDDHLMEISHIIRGEEWISSTPKHILLYNFLGWTPPIFAHMPLLRNPDKSKLSKRKNPVWVGWYKEQGFLPEAIINYLATLAWAHPEGKDIFTLEEMIEAFKLEDIQTTAPVFDIEKLRWINGEYLRKKSHAELKKMIIDFEKRIPESQKNLIDKIIPLVSERMKTLSEFWFFAGFFFEVPGKHPLNDSDKEVINKALQSVGDNWSHDYLEKAIRAESEHAGKKARDIFMELRVSITGETVGPPLLESLEILGKEETLARLRSTK